MSIYYFICRISMAITWMLMAPMVFATERAVDRAHTLNVAIQSAWQRSPQLHTLEARRDEMAAGYEATQTVIAGSPSLGLSQRTDRWTDRRGRQELEVVLSAPIWLPGQQSARQALAESATTNLEAQIIHTRWQIAGEVRERYWAVIAAREMLAEAQDHQQHLQALADEVQRRVNVGDLAKVDGMLAQQEVLFASTAVGSAQTRFNELLMRYRALTGQVDIADPMPESLEMAVPDLHPRLAMARSALQQAQAAVRVTDVVRSDPPIVGLSMRREQESTIANADRSVGLSVHIPLGTRSRNFPLEAAARTQIETATADLAMIESTLQLNVDSAHQQLEVAQQTLATAVARTLMTREYTQLMKKAFQLGERSLADVLRAQTLVHEADAAERQQRVALGLARAQLNQALGVMP